MDESKVKNVSASEACQFIQENPGLLILDVRTEEEYRQGHIPGAVLVPVEEFSSRVGEFAAYSDKPVLVYCASGGRSPEAVDILLNNHFSRVYHLYEGISGWVYDLESD